MSTDALTALSELPRPEHPRPTCRRSEYLCLNGWWQFEVDAGNSGLARGLLERELAERILVPFCPESKLSGLGSADFMRAVWYRRSFEVPRAFAGKRVLLHFQAVDHEATVWVNGREVGRHRGGFTPFSCDLSAVVKPGERATVVVRARDPMSAGQAIGKQSAKYEPYSCFYERTTGIWQSVWLEAVGQSYLQRPRITPDVQNGVLRVLAPIKGSQRGLVLVARLFDEDGLVCKARAHAGAGLSAALELAVPEARRRLWSPGAAHSYELELELEDSAGNLVDQVKSYAALRSIAVEGARLLLNDQPLFLRFVLDQGYYPGGIMTAASDADLERDIVLAQQAGFNGARLHQRVFEERFLYHADRLGFLVFGEFADWSRFGVVDGTGVSHSYGAEWLEALERDYSHPSIIGWCALNETAGALSDAPHAIDDLTRTLFLAAKAMDPSRPVIDASGYGHRLAETDLYDSHDYISEQDFAAGFAAYVERHARTVEGAPFVNTFKSPWGSVELRNVPYAGQPYFVSEMGGFRYSLADEPGTWGYGSSANGQQEFFSRIAACCGVLLDNPGISGFCYTQLYDIYPEQNGILTFEREPKLDLAALNQALSRKAAIEQPSQASEPKVAARERAEPLAATAS